MKLSQLVSQISDELLKGTSISSDQIKEKIVDAVRLLETANDFAYMNRYQDFTIDTSVENPRVLPLPVGLKSIQFLRLVLDFGEFHNLVEVLPKSITSVEVDIPNGYFKEGMEYLWFDNTPDQNYEGEISFRAFTEVEVDNDDYEPWLFKYGHVVVKYQTLLLFGPFIRDPELMQSYAVLFKTAFESFCVMNENLENSNTELQMIYK